MSRTKVKLGLLITVEKSDGYVHMNGSVVVIGRDGYQQQYPETYPNVADDAISHPSHRSVPGWCFDNLKITSQGNIRDEVEKRYLYGWRIGYANLYRVELDDARAMARTLGRLERSLRNLDVREPRHDRDSFGEYLLRVAHVIKATSFVFHADGGYEILDLLTGRRKIEQFIRRFQETGAWR